MNKPAATPKFDETRYEKGFFERRNHMVGTIDRFQSSNLSFIDPADLDPNMKYNFVTDFGNRCEYFYRRNYNFVEARHINNFDKYRTSFDPESETRLRKKVGMTAKGAGHFQYLMMIPKDWYQESQDEKAGVRSALLRGEEPDKSRPAQPYINTQSDAPTRRTGQIT